MRTMAARRCDKLNLRHSLVLSFERSETEFHFHTVYIKMGKRRKEDTLFTPSWTQAYFWVLYAPLLMNFNQRRTHLYLSSVTARTTSIIHRRLPKQTSPFLSVGRPKSLQYTADHTPYFRVEKRRSDTSLGLLSINKVFLFPIPDSKLREK